MSAKSVQALVSSYQSAKFVLPKDKKQGSFICRMCIRLLEPALDVVSSRNYFIFCGHLGGDATWQWLQKYVVVDTEKRAE